MHSVAWCNVGFAEGLRWHADELWYSDMRTRLVNSLDLSGKVTERAYIPGQPSGLGWRPDGTLLVSSMLDGLIIDATHPRKRIVADIGTGDAGPLNDMIVDSRGRVYVGSLGFHPSYGGIEPADLSPERVAMAVSRVPLLMVNPDGSFEAATEGLVVPNGMALLHHEHTLVVAETPLQRLIAFDVASSGTLSNQRIFAELAAPVDGICADRDGAIWVSQLMAEKFIRVAEGGAILDEIPTPGALAIACALGGENGKRLYGSVVTGNFDLWGSGQVQGQIRSWEVAVPAG